MDKCLSRDFVSLSCGVSRSLSTMDGLAPNSNNVGINFPAP